MRKRSRDAERGQGWRWVAGGWSFGIALCVATAASLAPLEIRGQQHPAEPPLELAETLKDAGVYSVEFPLRDSVFICEGGRMWRRTGGAAHGCSTERAEVWFEVGPTGVEGVAVKPVGGQDHDPSPRRLGSPPVAQLGGVLVSLAASGEEEVAEDAMGALSMVDSLVTWPALERIARDQDRPQGIRTTALFWLGQAAAERAARSLEHVARAGKEDLEVRQAAIFALSQHQSDDVVSTLMDLAQTLKEPELVKTTLFWLAQHDDPRVLQYLGEILRSDDGPPRPEP